MSKAVASTARSATFERVSGFTGLTLEAEIRSLYSLAPDSLEQLPTLFSESVVKSCGSVLGEASGEALVRRIGDRRLKSPEMVYGRVDSLLLGGSGDIKRVIKRAFRSKVHGLYRLVMKIQAP